jgi:hypothetical protein
LSLGGTAQQVEVTANASMVQTQETSVSEVVDQKRMVELPLNGRQVTQLILLAGAASAVNSLGDIKSSKNYPTSALISVAGGQVDGTNYLLDGAAHIDAWSNINLPFPFPDAMQEFSVQTSTLSARYGIHPGGVVNAVTKSGTNQFHGSAFEFLRNGDLNARDFFAASHDTLKRNQFGGTIGGPILKNRLFGFFGYQGTRTRTAPPSSIAFVPTQAVLNGDFSQLESAACRANGQPRTITNPATGQAFANAHVDPTLFNPQAVKLLKDVPVSSDPCGKLTYAVPMPQGEDQYIGRIDWNKSSKHNFFGRYFYTDYRSPAFFNHDFLLTNVRGVRDRVQTVALGETYSVTPTVVNTANIAFTRLSITRGPAPDFYNGSAIGLNLYQAAPTSLTMSVSGYFPIGCGSCTPSFFANNNTAITDNLDIIHGRHHFAVGGEWIHYQYNFIGYYNSNGIYSFNGQFSNDALLDFMLGLPSAFQQGNPERLWTRLNNVGIFGMDNIKLSPRLNLQLGFRWEPYLPLTETHNQIQHFDENAFAQGKRSAQFDNGPLGLFFIGDPGMPSGLTYSKLAIFQPRVGVAFDLTGTGRQMLRAGYGMFNDTPSAAYHENQPIDAPWGGTIALSSPKGGLTNPFLSYPGGNPFPLPSPPTRSYVFPTDGVYYNFPLDFQTLNMQQWNLSYELQLKNNWLISATYMGNKTTHLATATEANPALYIPGTCNGQPCSTTGNTEQRRLLYLQNPVAGAAYSSIGQAVTGDNAEFNSLLLTAKRRFSSHYTVLANYTYSHCIGDGDYQNDPGGSQVQNPSLVKERGNCVFDLRHNFNLSLIAETPRFSGWTGRLLGNWQLAPILSVHTGNWFTVNTGLDNSRTGVGLDRPDVVGDPYLRSTTGALQWLNPKGFAPNLIGAFGDLGRNALVGPGYNDIDVSLSRYFPITERHRLQLRFEFFNLLNHPNFNTPNSTLTSSAFGQIQSDVSPRILQFGMKYSF